MRLDGHTILLVDDNDDLREVTVELLEALGHRVVDTMRAQSALRIFEERADEIDLVVLEIVLPTMDGLELTERLRSRKPSLGVVVTSSHDNHRDLRDRVGRGELVFLRKPYTGQELAAKIEEALKAERRGPRTVTRERGDETSPTARPRERTTAPFLRTPSERRGSRRDRPARTRQRARLLDLGRSVLAGLVVFGLFVTLHFAGQRPPSLPDQVPESVTRGTVVEPISPVGELRSVPRELRWRPVAEAARYEARLLAVDESTLWRGSTEQPRLALPEEVRSRLHPRVVYFWTIEAFDGEGSRLSASERARFLVAGSSTS